MGGFTITNKLLACPICLGGKQKPRYSEDGLCFHLDLFHKRTDLKELVDLAKKLKKEGNQ